MRQVAVAVRMLEHLTRRRRSRMSSELAKSRSAVVDVRARSMMVRRGVHPFCFFWSGRVPSSVRSRGWRTMIVYIVYECIIDRIDGYTVSFDDGSRSYLGESCHKGGDCQIRQSVTGPFDLGGNTPLPPRLNDDDRSTVFGKLLTGTIASA